MKFYQEIYIFPDPETPRHELREKVFSFLHLAQIEAEKKLSGKSEIDSVRFGLSFPNYHASLHELDYTIRIFAPSAPNMETLDLSNQLKLVKDYLRIGEVQPVPEKVIHTCFKREQVKSGLERLARRQVKNDKRPSYDIALKMLKEKGTQTTQLPFVYTNTSSTGNHRIPIFIDKVDQEQEQSGTFTTYGLSKNGSTVPVF